MAVSESQLPTWQNGHKNVSPTGSLRTVIYRSKPLALWLLQDYECLCELRLLLVHFQVCYWEIKKEK